MRLLPAVAGIGVLLFGLKAAGLAFSANAAPAPAATPATPAAAAAPAKEAAPAADPLAAIDAALPNPTAKPDAAGSETAFSDALPPDLAAGVSSAAMDVLTSLSERRTALEARQRELDLRNNVITAAEKRVDDKIAQLKTLQTRIEQLLGQRDKQETETLDSLVRVYTAMKPKDAARIFASLDGNVRLGVAGRMKPDSIAGILAALPPDVAQKLTVELAGRYKLPPETAAAAAAATTPEAAPAAPAPATPAPVASAAPAAPAPAAATPAPNAAPPAKPPGG
jgi:flagellar motility protein MotE (MotC chaperone)